MNSDKTLYFRDYKGEKNIKILDDVIETITSIVAANQGGSGSIGWFKFFEDGSVVEE